MTNKRLLTLFGLFILLFSLPMATSAQEDQRPSDDPDTFYVEPASGSRDTPEILYPEDNPISNWTVGRTRIVWHATCDGEFFIEGDVNRGSTSGGFQTNMGGSSAANCSGYSLFTTDGSALYYYDSGSSRIKRKQLFSPYTETEIATLTTAPRDNLVVNDDYVYWIQQYSIMRVPKAGGTTQFITTPAQGTAIAIDDYFIWWLDNNGLRSVSINCGTSCTATTRVTGASGEYIYANSTGTTGFGVNVYWSDNAQSTDRVRRFYSIPDFLNGGTIYGTSLIYTAASGVEVRGLTHGGGNLFWLEKYGSPLGNTRLKRQSSGAGVETLADGMSFSRQRIFSDDFYVYFIANPGIGRLSHDAAALVRDFAVDEWEVTQGIQRTANDVPLIAEKPTFVRVYGEMLDGLPSFNVSAELHGTRNGNPLPGSPLTVSLNGNESLIQGDTYDRADARAGWLFELPPSWITEGNTVLRVVIDPDDIYQDTNPANNERTQTFTFHDEAQACVVAIPVVTHAPLPTQFDPNFDAMVQRFTELWPVHQTTVAPQPIPIAELEVCWFGPFPHPCFGPYELDDEGLIPDRDRLMARLMLRYVSTALAYNLPGVCPFHESSVHFMGMVHPDSETGGLAGYANLVLNTSFVKSPPHDLPSDDWAWPFEGNVMAQELAHNLGRRHVNCGSPDNVDVGYPYPPCQLDNVGANNHYGFDTQQLVPIAPNAASDYMSYGSRNWTSDYTYEAVRNIIPAPLSRSVLAAPGDSLLVVGVINEVTGDAYFEPMFHVPNDMRSMSALAQAQEVTPPRWSANRVPDDTYHIRLIGANSTILDDRTITLGTGDTHVHEGQALPFVLNITLPNDPVEKVELLNKANEVLMVIPVSDNSPQVTILSPIKTTYTDSMEIKWTGTDADGDVLRYHIHYSGDQGASWTVIASDIVQNPNDSTNVLTLDKTQLDMLPGSNSAAKIRITATDGFNTTIVDSVFFTLAYRAPNGQIIRPQPEQWYAGDTTVQLAASGQDAEQGALGDSAFSWQVDGIALGTGKMIQVDGLRTGEHVAVLTTTDNNGLTDSDSVTFHVAAVDVPSTSAPMLDGYCHDSVYENALALPMETYADGSHATAYIGRSATDLWLCVKGLPKGTGSLEVDFDTNGNRSANPEPTDYALLLSESGALTPYSGTGSGFSGAGPTSGYATALIRSDNDWSAEFKVSSTLLGGFDKQIGFNIVQSGRSWPRDATYLAPSTWGLLNLGDAPVLDTISPRSTTIGTGDLTLTLTGSNFINGNTVLFNGTPLATTFVNAGQLTAVVPSSLLIMAGTSDVQVQGAATRSTAFTSTPQPFQTTNPTPTLTALSPDEKPVNDPEFTLTLTGSDFVDGAVVMWDGQALATTFVDSETLEVVVSADFLTLSRISDINVRNPAPTSGTSETRTFIVRGANTPTQIALQSGTVLDNTPATIALLVVTTILTLTALVLNRRKRLLR